MTPDALKKKNDDFCINKYRDDPANYWSCAHATNIKDQDTEKFLLERCIMSSFANKEYGFKFPLTNKYRCLNINNIYIKDPLVNKCLGAKGKLGAYN